MLNLYLFSRSIGFFIIPFFILALFFVVLKKLRQRNGKSERGHYDTDSLSVVCGSLAIAMFIVSFAFGILWVVGAILGVAAIIFSRKTKTKSSKSYIGLVTGIISLIAIFGYLLIGNTVQCNNSTLPPRSSSSPPITSSSVPPPAPPSDPPTLAPREPAHPDPAPPAPLPQPSGADTGLLSTEGYSIYENDTYNFKLQYPEEWIDFETMSIYIDVISSLVDSLEETIGLLVGTLEIDEVKAARLYVAWLTDSITDNSILNLYDYKNADATMCPNVDLNIIDEIGDSQSTLMNPIFQRALMNTVVNTLDDYETVIDVQGQIFGNNYFVFYAVNANIFGDDTSVYYAITENDGNAYQFMFSTRPDLLESSMSIYENILSSMEFM